MDILNDSIKLIRAFWYNRFLPLVILGIAIAMIIIFNCFEVWRLILIGFLALSILIIWTCTTQVIPKCPKGKIGILLAIQTENDTQYLELQNKLVKVYKNLLCKNKFSSNFFICTLNPYQLKRFVDIDRMNDKNYSLKIMQKTRNCLCIFGNCLGGNIDNNESYSLEFHTSVVQNPVPEIISERLDIEFANVFPSNIAIPKSNDIKEFKQVSEHMELSTKYILGTSFLVSGYFSYAKATFEELYLDVKANKHNTHILQLLEGLIKDRLHEIYFFFSEISYYRFFYHSGSQSDLTEFDTYLEKANSLKPYTYHYRLDKAISLFLSGDIESSHKMIRSCLKEKDVNWKYSDAFLLAYKGKLLSAYNRYKQAFKQKYYAEQLLMIEEFISKVMDKEPDNGNLYFASGIINFYQKEDYFLARNDFIVFLLKTPNCDDTVKALVNGLISISEEKLEQISTNVEGKLKSAS